MVRERSVRLLVALERDNPDYVGGDVNGRVRHIGQLYSRSASMFSPYEVPSTDPFICSSVTPPGGGVHGMCGSYATRAVLRRLDR